MLDSNKVLPFQTSGSRLSACQRVTAGDSTEPLLCQIWRRLQCRAGPCGGTNTQSHIGFCSHLEPFTKLNDYLSFICFKQQSAEVVVIVGCLCSVWSLRRNVFYVMSPLADLTSLDAPTLNINCKKRKHSR